MASNSPRIPDLIEKTKTSFQNGKIFLKYLPQLCIHETIFTKTKRDFALKMTITRHNLNYEIFCSETK